MNATGGVFTRTGATVASEGGAPRASAYGAAFRAHAGAAQSHGTIVRASGGTAQQVGGFASAAAHASAVSSGGGYGGVLPLGRAPRINKPRPWLAGTPLAGQ